MMKSIGQITITIGKNKPKESAITKELRTEKRQAKKDYQKALKEDRNSIKPKMERYINAQKQLKEQLENDNKERTQNKLENMIQDGKLNSQKFWKLKYLVENKSGPEPYDIITEEGGKLTEEKKQKNMWHSILKSPTRHNRAKMNISKKQ